MSTPESYTAKLLALRPVMEAFLKGEKIEAFAPGGRRWVSTSNPQWNPEWEYRVKKVPRVYYIEVATVYNKVRPGTINIISEQAYISQKIYVGQRTDFPWEYIKVVEEVSP